MPHLDSHRSMQRYRFLFVSSNATWGGSEELWSRTAEALASGGHTVAVRINWRDRSEPNLRRLRDLGCKISGGWLPDNLPGTRHPLMAGVVNRLRRVGQTCRFRLFLTLFRRQDLIVISQGKNNDGLSLAGICRDMGLPYVLIAQKATEMYWPTDTELPGLRAAYAGAVRCFFVSHHNLRLTEEQLGMPLPHGSVVRNPFLVPWQWKSDWPDSTSGFHLACVGRLEPSEKGQDLLLRVLARPKWRERPLKVTFYGGGPQRDSLERMARFLGVTSVSFGGFVRDIVSVWQAHHGLVLPSRCEGLPLAVVEAMLCGRPPILTAVAGNPEVVEDGRTGFLASAPTEDALDAALESAWQRRSEWQAIGAAAAAAIRELVPADPPGVMANILLDIVKARSSGLDERSETASHSAVGQAAVAPKHG